VPKYRVFFYYLTDAKDPEQAEAYARQVLDERNSQMYCYHHKTELIEK
jgi:hypothetical protein